MDVKQTMMNKHYLQKEEETEKCPPLNIEDIKNTNSTLVIEYDDTYDQTDISELIPLSESGNPTALCELAARYRCGVDGVEKDEEKSANLYYESLKKQRNTAAARHIGEAYFNEVFGEEYKTEVLVWYKLASDWGDGKASEYIGLLYEDGEIVEHNIDTALEWHKKALGQGNKHAFFNIADCYAEKEDYTKAKYYYEKSIEEAEVYYAYVQLGRLYENGRGVDKNEEKAFNMYKLAYQHDIKGDGAYYMARLYYDGRGVEESNEKAYKLFLEALDSGITEANYFLGILNYLGENENPVVKRDADTAIKYLSAAPEHMADLANEGMGYICWNEGRREDAIKYYEKAKELGSESAASFLSKINQTPEDKRKAFLNYLLNADIDELLKQYENGVKEAAFPIGCAYCHGEKGAETDYTKALMWFNKVIEEGTHGVDNAYFELAFMYLEGEGVAKNTTKAIEYFELAANNGFAYAATMLGETYRRGEHVPVDMEKSVFWYKKAAEAGDKFANQALFELYLQGKVDNKPNPEKAIECLRGVLAKEPNNAVANINMAKFYQKGLSDNGKEVVRQDVRQAIAHYKIAAENGKIEAYDELGHIYCSLDSPFYDYKAAIECFEKAAQKGYVWSYANLAMAHLCNDFRNEALYNPQRGIQAAKEFLEKGDGSRGLKETVMELMMCYYDGTVGKDSPYCRQEYAYLFNHFGTMGMAYTTEENKKRFNKLINVITKRLMLIYLEEGFNGIEKIIAMLGELEHIADRNKYIKDSSKEALMTHYFDLATYYLHNHQLENAKAFYEKAAWNGSEEAEEELKHFTTNFFGKLIYK
jgi:hypothetical protein